MDKITSLKELQALLDSNSITESEYHELKSEILNSTQSNQTLNDELIKSISGNIYLEKLNNLKDGLPIFLLKFSFNLFFGIYTFLNQQILIVDQAGSPFNFIALIFRTLSPIRVVFILIWINSLLWTLGMARLVYWKLLTFSKNQRLVIKPKNTDSDEVYVFKFKNFLSELLELFVKPSFYKTLVLLIIPIGLTYAAIWFYSGLDLFRSQTYTVEYVEEAKFSLNQPLPTPNNTCYKSWKESSSKLEAGQQIPLFFTTRTYYPMDSPLLNKNIINNHSFLSEALEEDINNVTSKNHSPFQYESHRRIGEAEVLSSVLGINDRCTFTFQFKAPIFAVECYGFCRKISYEYGEDGETPKDIQYIGNLDPHLHRSITMLVPKNKGTVCVPDSSVNLGKYSYSAEVFWDENTNIMDSVVRSDLWSGYEIKWFNTTGSNPNFECNLFSNYFVPFWYEGGEDLRELAQKGFMRVVKESS
mgnify:CR=1 FL=1